MYIFKFFILSFIFIFYLNEYGLIEIKYFGWSIWYFFEKGKNLIKLGIIIFVIICFNNFIYRLI